MLPVHIRSCSLYRSIRRLDPAAAFLFSHSDPHKIFPVLSARLRSRMASFRQLVIPARFFSLSHPVMTYAKLEIRNIPAVFRHDKSFLPGQSSRFQCLAVPEFRIRIPLSGKEPPSKITAEFRSRNSFPQTHEQKRKCLIPLSQLIHAKCPVPARVYPVDVPAVGPFQISQKHTGRLFISFMVIQFLSIIIVFTRSQTCDLSLLPYHLFKDPEIAVRISRPNLPMLDQDIFPHCLSKRFDRLMDPPFPYRSFTSPQKTFPEKEK